MALSFLRCKGRLKCDVTQPNRGMLPQSHCTPYLVAAAAWYVGMSSTGREDSDEDVARCVPDSILDNAGCNWHLGLLAHHSSCSGLSDALQPTG